MERMRKGGSGERSCERWTECTDRPSLAAAKRANVDHVELQYTLTADVVKLATTLAAHDPWTISRRRRSALTQVKYFY